VNSSLLVFYFFFIAHTISPAQPLQALSADTLRTEVVLIGTIHDSHNSSPYYTVRELKHLLRHLRPDILLIEVPQDQMGVDGRVREQDRVGPELLTADEVARELHIPQIPFDHPRRNERNSDLLKRWNEIQPRIAQLNKDIKSKNSLDAQFIRLYALADAGLKSTQTRATSAIVNSDVCDALTSVYYSIYQDILVSIAESYPGYNDVATAVKWARSWWHERNTVMAENIANAAKAYSGRRLVVMTGSSHRYILRDLLAQRKGIAIKESWQLLNVNLLMDTL